MMDIIKETLLLLCCSVCLARIRVIEISNDSREQISLSNFGFNTGGKLEVQLENFRVIPENSASVYGFSLYQASDDGVNLNIGAEQCPFTVHLEDYKVYRSKMIHFKLDLEEKTMKITSNHIAHIYKLPYNIGAIKFLSPWHSSSFTVASEKKGSHTYYNVSFAVAIVDEEEQGLYNLYFCSCPNYKEEVAQAAVDFSIKMVEQNIGTYLSVDEMPLPSLYYTMSILFLLSAIFWMFYLQHSIHVLYRIHYLLTILIFLKAASLAFCGLNYYYIHRLGVHLVPWAIMVYISHFFQTILFDIMLLLISIGLKFNKHLLKQRWKIIFLSAVITLQVFANIADVILRQTEEAAKEYSTWKNILQFSDLFCVICILISIVQSMRQLRISRKTANKAKNLKLLKCLYVMIACYFYFTRVISNLITLTVPYKFLWSRELFSELCIYIFIVLTAYKLRPSEQNPYLRLIMNVL